MKRALASHLGRRSPKLNAAKDDRGAHGRRNPRHPRSGPCHPAAELITTAATTAPERRLTPTRVGLAVIAGALTGAGVVTLHWLNMVVRALGFGFVANGGGRGVFITFLGVFFGWLAGLVLIGGPAWWLLHRHRLRGWWTAALAGMAATFAAGLILAIPLPHKGGGYSQADRGGALVENDQLTAYGWEKAAEGALLLSFVGGAVGLVVWKVAYRP